MTTAVKTTWTLKGEGIGACSCDWGCPCNFDAPPTKTWCEGGYAFHVTDGRCGSVELTGLHIGFYAHSPQAIHLGNITSYLLVDERASAPQRAALGRILDGELGGIFAIFPTLTTKLIGPEYVPVEFKFDGPNSYAKFGDRADIRLAEMKNPVTGEGSRFNLRFSNGLMTNEADLMTTAKMTVSHPEMSYDHSGQYGETFHFDFSGEG